MARNGPAQHSGARRSADQPSGFDRSMKWLAYAPAAAWTAFVLWLGSRTWEGVVGGWDWQPNDKFLHFIMYGTLGLLLRFGWQSAGRRPAALLPFLFGVAVGVYDELHQRTIPGRTADVRDFLVDVLAVTCGFFLFAFITQLRLRRNRGLRSS
ncbi:MAG: VanZ family protein [Longimicrobiales bacterium]